MGCYHALLWVCTAIFDIWERALMTSQGRWGVLDSPKKGRYRVGQGKQVGQKWPKNEVRH